MTNMFGLSNKAVPNKNETAADLASITGLKSEYAIKCFDTYGGYAPALASFAQSFKNLPESYFDKREVAVSHINQINEELKAIYRIARQKKAAAAGQSDEQVWKAYHAITPSPTASAALATNPESSVAVFASPTTTSSCGNAATTEKKGKVIFTIPSKTINPFRNLADTAASTAAQTTGATATATTQPAATLPTAFPAFTTASFGAKLSDTAAPAKSVFQNPSSGIVLDTSSKHNDDISDNNTRTTKPFNNNENDKRAGNDGNSAAAAAAPAIFGFGQPLHTSSAVDEARKQANEQAAMCMGAVPPTMTKEATKLSSAASTEKITTTTTKPAASLSSAKKAEQYTAPTHFVGPFFDMPRFWDTEVVARAPLLNLDNGFLSAHKEELRPRMLRWVERSSFYNSPVRYVEIADDDEDVVRVIIKDADRTFWQPEHREKLVAFLHAMYHEFNAYGQAMSYLAGLCMLVLTENESASVIRFVATEYIKGHWAAEAVGFATSAWVVEHFMHKLMPDVAEHLELLKLWPDTYLQKILTGLCIHVLQFDDLFRFLDAFMQGGLEYLIKFCLAIVEHFRLSLLAVRSCNEANTVYEIMRLDARMVDHTDVESIFERATQIDLGEEGTHLDVIRSQVYSKKVEPRLARAPKTDTFEPCEKCDKRKPKWWSEDTGAVCDECKAVCGETIKFESF